jgi:hypothetical protein
MERQFAHVRLLDTVATWARRGDDVRRYDSNAVGRAAVDGAWWPGGLLMSRTGASAWRTDRRLPVSLSLHVRRGAAVDRCGAGATSHARSRSSAISIPDWLGLTGFVSKFWTNVH